MQLKKFAKCLFALILSGVLILCGTYTLIQSDGNFHAVEEGNVYRSGQLDGDKLNHRIKDVGIKSVLNLLGENQGQEWYGAEVAISNSHGIEHINYRMSSRKLLNLDQMHEVLQIIENAPKPILIHCNAGADRTGLVSALYLANKGGKLEKVQDALSIRYGHLPIFHWAETIAMDKSLSLFLSNKFRKKDHDK